MAWTGRRIISLILVTLVIGGLCLAAYTVDQMALGYLTGQRRVPGQDFYGRATPVQGPPPGYLSLGSLRSSRDPEGLKVLRPNQLAVSAGLQAGDVLLSVDGKNYGGRRILVRDLLAKYSAGDRVTALVRRGAVDFEVQIPLQPFLRSPADLGLEYQEVEISSRSGFRLKGWYLPPRGGVADRMAIFVHGAKSSRYQALEGAPYWHERGYGLLTMDLSGRGTSEGEYVTYTVNERKDVLSMVEWAGSEKGLSAGQAVVFGTSNGAASAIYAAAEIADLAALVLDAPYSDLWQEAREMMSVRGVRPELVHLLRWAVRWRAGVDVRDIRPIEVIQAVRAPVLFIHGDADTQVPPYHSELLHQKRLEAGLPSQRWIIEGGEHGFDYYPPVGEFWGRVIDFADQQIGVRQPPLESSARVRALADFL